MTDRKDNIEPEQPSMTHDQFMKTMDSIIDANTPKNTDQKSWHENFLSQPEPKAKSDNGWFGRTMRSLSNLGYGDVSEKRDK